MKKDSTTRIERRLAKKKFKKENKNMLKRNKCWDELEMLHAATVGLLYSTKNITPLLRSEEIMSKIDSKEAVKISQVIANDLTHYKEKIEVIHNKHKNKTGGSDDPDVLMECIMIGQEYMELSDSFQRVVSPNIDRLLEMAASVADADSKTNSEVIETPIEEKPVEVSNEQQ